MKCPKLLLLLRRPNLLQDLGELVETLLIYCLPKWKDNITVVNGWMRPSVTDLTQVWVTSLFACPSFLGCCSAIFKGLASCYCRAKSQITEYGTKQQTYMATTILRTIITAKRKCAGLTHEAPGSLLTVSSLSFVWTNGNLLVKGRGKVGLHLSAVCHSGAK